EAPPRDGPREGGPRGREGRGEGPGGHNDPARFRERLIEAIQRVAITEANQTNSYYFQVWQCEGEVLVTSTNAPAGVPIPKRNEAQAQENGQGPGIAQGSGKGPGGPGKFSGLRTRGEFREAYVFTPFGDCLLVGRSMAPDLAAMR